VLNDPTQFGECWGYLLNGFCERQKFPQKVEKFTIEFEALNLKTKTSWKSKLEKVFWEKVSANGLKL